MKRAAAMLTELGPKFSLPMCQYRLRAHWPQQQPHMLFARTGRDSPSSVQQVSTMCYEMRSPESRLLSWWGMCKSAIHCMECERPADLIRISPTIILSATLGPR